MQSTLTLEDLRIRAQAHSNYDLLSMWSRFGYKDRDEAYLHGFNMGDWIDVLKAELEARKLMYIWETQLPVVYSPCRHEVHIRLWVYIKDTELKDKLNNLEPDQVFSVVNPTLDSVAYCPICQDEQDAAWLSGF